MESNKNTNEISQTQLDISVNDDGAHVEMKFSWKRLSRPGTIIAFLLSNFATILITVVNLPQSPHIPDSTPPQVEIPNRCDRQSDM